MVDSVLGRIISYRSKCLHNRLVLNDKSILVYNPSIDYHDCKSTKRTDNNDPNIELDNKTDNNNSNLDPIESEVNELLISGIKFK